MPHLQSTYQPTTKIGKWMDERLPLARLIHAEFREFPTPRNLNYLWTFGGILSFLLVAQIATGVVLAMHYQPSAEGAFDSIEHIRRNVDFGWLLRALHAVGASMFFFAVYIHIAKAMYYGSYKEPREVLWILGVLLLAVMIATAFLGYSLPWGQMSFWAATVITNLFSSLDGVIPGFGTAIVEWLWGGYSVTGVTLSRFYSLHYLLPFILAGLVILHIWALHVSRQNNPTGVEARTDEETLPMAPYALAKDLVGLAAFLVLFAWFVFFLPDYLSHADNYIPANPLVTPAHVVPEWYFLPFYAILRAIPSKLGGVIALFASVGVLLFVPWLDRSRVRSTRYRPIYKWFFWLFVVTCLALGYLGSKPAEGIYVILSRLFTTLYFAHFLLVLPFVGLIETPSREPPSVAAALRERDAGAGLDEREAAATIDRN